jgi:hypothetical protein
MIPVTQLFNRLVVGLQQASQVARTKPWQYTPHLQRVANLLSVTFTTQLPATATALRYLLSQPVQAWWPAQWPVPADFDTSFGLLEGTVLSEEASAYYHQVLVAQAELTNFADHGLQLTLDNEEFRVLLAELRQKAEEPGLAAIAQREYVALRRFLIEHPIATGGAITAAFGSKWLVRAERVGAMYENCRGPLWHCQHCGPLLSEGGQLRGIRPSVCSDHLPDQLAVTQLADAPDLRRLRPGIHWRVCFPGKPELHLYNILEAWCQQHPQVLAGVELWPNLDQYDIRLVFRDGTVWAVDVKDQRDPARLGTNLLPPNSHNGLAYTRGFYVIPDRWLRRNASAYLRTVRDRAALPGHISVLGLQSFIELVQAELTRCPKNKRRTI